VLISLNDLNKNSTRF